MSPYLGHGARPRMLVALLSALCAVVAATALGAGPAAAADQRHPVYANAPRRDTHDGVDPPLKHRAHSLA
ncbi:phospholipase, partial [Streptomyces nojiriensis]